MTLIWTATILDAAGHFQACAQSWFVLDVSFVTLYEIQFLNELQVIQCRPLTLTHMSGWKHAWQLTHALPCQRARSRSVDWNGIQSTRAPHHNTTEPGGDPIQTEQMGHAVELQNRPSAPLSSSDPNTNWHLINILSEGFISLTSRCLFFFSLRKTIDALITQNSICERERPATHAHRLKWAVQKWMNAHFIPLRKEVFFILQAFLSLLI